MVFFFEPRGCQHGGEDWLIYMGRDKFENEDLIRYGLPNDIWCVPVVQLVPCSTHIRRHRT
jgi:NFACT protein RNA binding domain